MKSKLCLLLKVLLCFLLLYSQHEWVEMAYRAALLPAGSLLLAFDVQNIHCGEACSLRIIAFLSLVLLTPNAKILHRLFVAAIGLAVFIGIDLAGLFLWPTAHSFHPVAGETLFYQGYGVIWNLLRDLLLPFLLWLVAFDRHLGLFRPTPVPLDDLEQCSSLSEG